MKKLIVVLAVVAMAVPALAVITGSAHDFSSATWNSGGEKCQPCHTPHNAYQNGTEIVPLWNHYDSTTASFTVYSSPYNTLDGGALGQPAGVSKACLSCHDGSVALDSFGGTAGSTTITGAALLGADLSNDHPVSFTWPTTDDEIKPTTTTVTFADSSTGTIADMLFSNQMECASCHDVHNTVSESANSLLLIDNAGSALCLTCHDK